MNRRQRTANISATEYAKFFSDFLAFVQSDYRIFELTDAVLLEAQRLLETNPLRAGDAGLTRFGSARQRSTAIRQSSRADFPRFRRAFFDGGKQRRLTNRRPAESLVFRIDYPKRKNE